MTVSLMTVSLMTVSLMTVSLMTVSLMTVSLITVSVYQSVSDVEENIAVPDGRGGGGGGRVSPVSMKRTGSLDTIVGPYLKGEWPREPAATAAAITTSVSPMFYSQPAITITSTADKNTQV